METVQKNQKRSEVKVNGLERLLNNASYEGEAAALVGIEICLQNRQFAEKLAGILRDKFAFLEGHTPGNAAQQNGLDLECDLLPAVQWLRFLDGYKAAMISETGCDKESQRTESGEVESLRTNQIRREEI